MRPFRLGRWGSPILPLATRPPCPFSCSCPGYSLRYASAVAGSTSASDQPIKRKRGRPRKHPILESNVAAVATSPASASLAPDHAAAAHASSSPIPGLSPMPKDFSLEQLPSPPLDRIKASAKLSALHARLSLPSKLPIQSLARSLIHPTADPDTRFNNAALAVLGNDLFGYYMAEHILVHYPRLPMAVLFAAQHAYVGPAALASVAESWGVEVAAEPGGEVDPGLLQFKRAPPGTVLPDGSTSTRPVLNRRGDTVEWKRGMTSRVVFDDMFGEVNRDDPQASSFVTLDRAATQFVRALLAAIYLHAGGNASYAFFKQHVLSRHLDLANLFTFTHPTRDLARLCAREGFEAPVARLDSESGRLSRHPVFVVGIYSGRERLGQDAGASLDEARFKAAIAALKGWYLYSPVAASSSSGLAVPSMMERGAVGKWRPAHVDIGEVVN